MKTYPLTSFDGTELTVYEGGNPDGPPLILSNGLGGNIIAWRHVVRHFSAHFRILCWDYRGLYKSAPAPTDADYTIAKHASDLGMLLEATGVQNPILVGWSMGVQVNFELLRCHDVRPAAIIALNGTPGTPFKTAFNTDFFDSRIGRLCRFAKDHWTRTIALRPYVTRDSIIDGFVRAIQLTGIASRSLDRRVFRDLAMEWITLDLGVYATIFDELARHDAMDLLGHVAAPTLVIAGQKDRFTPAHRSTVMASSIRDAELCVIPRATHFCPVEYPDAVNRRMTRFLEERGLLSAGRPAGRSHLEARKLKAG